MKKSLIRNLMYVCAAFCVMSIMFLLLIAQLDILWIYTFVLAAPFLILTSYTITYIKRRIISPIKLLVKETRLISAGDLSRPVPYQHQDELGDLACAFEQMREKLYFEQQQQMQFEQERKTFIDSISHDLKTPLAAISAYVEGLQDGLAETKDEEEQYLKVIASKIRILTDLSSQLSLSYESPSSIQYAYQKVNCYAWTTQFFCELESAGRVRQQRISATSAISSKSKECIMIDPCQFERAIQNMSENAFRYTEDIFLIHCEIKNQQFVLTMENDGVTLLPNQITRVFDRFFSEEKINDQGHLGLGLYISKTLIRGMQGEVTATMNEGRIIFTITLPVCYPSNIRGV